jgi:hypothetical protein
VCPRNLPHARRTVSILLFQDYKNFSKPMVATKLISCTGDRMRRVTITSMSYEPIADSVFDLLPAVSALLKRRSDEVMR